ncbi:MAG: sulfatase family protein [Promethearchaeota archaeon]
MIQKNSHFYCEEKKEHPNVLYIISHDQGTAARCYALYSLEASETLITPNIDNLANEGVILTQHFATSPLCSPARASLLTSKLPHQNGLVGLVHRGFSLNKGEKTVLHAFKDQGYKTILIGFQHESKDPYKLGYSEVHAKIPIFRNIIRSFKKVLKNLEKQCKKGKKFSPFWITIGSIYVHLPWNTKARPIDENKVEVPPFLPDTPETRKDQAYFVAVLKKYDEFIGKILKIFKKSIFYKNTIIVLTTDHGVAHPRAKATLYDPGVHTLMIFKGVESNHSSYNNSNNGKKDEKFEYIKPLRPIIPKSAVVKSLLSQIDFAPTICELCGIPPLKEFKGKSYAELLQNAKKDNGNAASNEINEYIFIENTYHDKYNPMRGIRTKKYKLILNFENQISLIDSICSDIRRTASFKAFREKVPNKPKPKEEFYDLQKDPLEMENIAEKNPNHPELQNLKEILLNKLKEDNDLLLKGYYPAPENAKVSNADDFQHTKHLKWRPKNPEIGR